MKEQGFTLIELLAVIVILAIIALIATPIVLNIISNTKENAQLRSAEMYLDAVEQSVMREKMEDTTFKPNECEIKDKKLYCNGEGEELKVEVDGEKPNSGNITFTEGKIDQVTLKYSNGKTVVKDNKGSLVYAEGSGGFSENIILYEPFDVLDTNVWTINNKGDLPEAPCPIEIREDTEQGNVLYIGAKTSSNKVRGIRSADFSIPTDVKSVNFSFKFKIEGTSAGNTYLRMVEYKSDGSTDLQVAISTKTTNDEWVEYSGTVTRTEGYLDKMACEIYLLATCRVPVYVDDIKITY